MLLRGVAKGIFHYLLTVKTLRTEVELTSNLPFIKFYQTKVRPMAKQKLFYLAHW